MRVAVVTSSPTPYRDPFWNTVARQEGSELHVFYCMPNSMDRPWEVAWPMEYRAVFLPGHNLFPWGGSRCACFWNPTLQQQLRRFRYDAMIIGGYSHLTMLFGMRYAIRKRIPYFLFSESTLELPRPFWRRLLKGVYLRWVIRNAAGGFPTGSLARDYLLHYGATPDTLTCIPNVPDVVALGREAEVNRLARGELRRRHGFHEESAIALYVGRLIAQKNLDVLIRAFRAARRKETAKLAIVGTGPHELPLRRLASELGLEEHVKFVGWVQPQHLSKWYAMADVFVQPSSETWGVVAIEALASGLPVILSNGVGAHPDIVNDPVVGDVVPVRCESRLAEALGRRLANPLPWESVRRAWSPVRDSFVYDALARKFMAALQRLAGRDRSRENSKETAQPAARSLP